MAVDDEDEKFTQLQINLRDTCEQKLNATTIPGKIFSKLFNFTNKSSCQLKF